MPRTPAPINANFTCIHCGAVVTAERWASGVNNRNHCPYCLWSRHVDLNEAGDRLSPCKAGMEPVGLTLKQVRKKYARPDQGELMLIHRCAGCGSFSINRIAADDLPDMILQVFDGSLAMPSELRSRLEDDGIRVLSEAGRAVVRSQLFGKGN